MPLNNPISESQIPQPIARDSEVTAAVAAHVAAADPHPTYLTEAEGAARYQSILPVSIVQQQVNLPAQISILANTWFNLGVFGNVNPGNAESLFAMSLFVQYVTAGETAPYWQYSGACLISPIWWKAGGTQLVKYIDMEAHNGIDFILSFRMGMTQSDRMVQLYFPISLAARLIRATFVRLR
jgi:hypothetical protein